MSLSKSWQFVGSVDGVWYRAFDWLRRRLNVRLAAFLCRRLEGKSGWRSLEAGSGTAYASSLLADRRDVGRVVCMDVDVEALRLARLRDGRLFAVVGDLTKMPFRDGAFDLVFNSSTVEHLDEPGRAVFEMRRVCDGAGSVFVGVPYLWGPLMFQRLIAKSTVGVWLGTVFGRRRLGRLLGDAGLAPVVYWTYFCRFFIGAVAEPMERHR